MTSPAPSLAARAAAALRLRCPRCLRGRAFRGLLAMNETCPECGLKFAREPGYFFGAMYVSYALAVAVLTVGVLAGWLLFPGAPVEWLVAGASGVLVALTPLIFRYSRVIWMHVDWFIDRESKPL